MSFMVLIKKAMAKLEIDPERIPQEMFSEIFKRGMEEVINLKTSKLKLSPKALKELDAGTEADKKLAREQKALAMAQAERNLEDIYAGTFKIGRPSGATDASGAKLSREVQTEAMRVARAKVKDALREAKVTLSHVPAGKITEAAKKILEANPEIIEEAKATVAAKTKVPVKLVGIDIEGMASPDLAAKVTARNAKRKAEGAAAADKVLSAAQAPKVKPRPQPQA